jgi:hypothetical protein
MGDSCREEIMTSEGGAERAAGDCKYVGQLIQLISRRRGMSGMIKMLDCEVIVGV